MTENKTDERETTGKLWVETPDGEMRCLGAAYGVYAEDDTEEAILKRLDIYHNETEPILEKYKDKVIKIDAGDNPQAIFERVEKAIEKESQ